MDDESVILLRYLQSNDQKNRKASYSDDADLTGTEHTGTRC